MKNISGDCDDGAYYLLEDAGNMSQNDCANKCETKDKCVGYSFKQTSCLLRKNIHLCPKNKWVNTNGYIYYAKPIKLNFVLNKEPSNSIYGNKLPANSANKFCLQAPANAQASDKIVTEPCSNNSEQLFTIVEETIETPNPTNPNSKIYVKLYQTKHFLSGLCLDIMEYDIDSNPIRLSNCNIEPEIYYPSYLIDSSSANDKIDYFTFSYNIQPDSTWALDPAFSGKKAEVKNSSKNIRKKRLFFTSSKLGDLKLQYEPMYVILSTKFSLDRSAATPP